jgi:hypothetical protein
MNGLDNHYANMLADHQRMLDEQAQKEEEMDSFKDNHAKTHTLRHRKGQDWPNLYTATTPNYP